MFDYRYWWRLAFADRYFFRKGVNSMLGNESIEVWLLVALAVLFVQVVAVYLAVKTGEKIHEKRMKEIKEKEQV